MKKIEPKQDKEKEGEMQGRMTRRLREYKEGENTRVRGEKKRENGVRAKGGS